MKTKLLFLCYFFITSSFFAQNTWVGTVDDKWSNKDNWSGEVPTNSDDVLIPSGFAVTLDTPADIVSIKVEGNSILNVTQSLIIDNPSEFGDNVVVNWSGGDFSGTGILTNKGTINMSFPSFDISGVLNNPGTINLTAGGTIFIGTNGVINNSGTGIIDFKTSGTSITKSGGAPNVLNNYGTIKTSFPNSTDESYIGSQLINHDGIFQIESGILSFNNTTVNLMGAQFNIFSGTILNLKSPTTVSGTLRGNVFGDLNWNNDLIVSTTAFFDFGGNQSINWNGDLNGGGTLTNQTIINRNTASNVFIDGNTTLDNEGEIRLTNTGDIFIRAGSAINNNAAGLIDFLVDGSGISFNPGGPLNNAGLIKGNVSSGSATINALVNNSGTIEAAQNTLVFSGILNNQSTGVIKGVATIDLPIPANFTNDGAIAPGASPGTLTLIGDYESTGTSGFNAELNGSTQGIDYDLLSVQGNASFEGDIDIVLGYEPNVNDEFIVVSTTGIITNCNLPATKSVNYNGFDYNFSVTCRNNNELVLTATSKTLGVDYNKPLSSVRIYPNPVESTISFSSNLIVKTEIYDINGRHILNGLKNSVSVKYLSKGVYIIKGFTSENQSISKKFIKN